MLVRTHTASRQAQSRGRNSHLVTFQVISNTNRFREAEENAGLGFVHYRHGYQTLTVLEKDRERLLLPMCPFVYLQT